MNILVAGSEVPATNAMPGSPRLFSLCRILARRHRLTLVALGTGSERVEAFRRDPQSGQVFSEVRILPEAPRPAWLGRQRHRLRLEANIVTRYRTPAYFADQRRALADVMAAQRFDVLLADGLPISQYLLDASLEVPAIIDLHDCFTLLFQRTARAETRWLRKLSLYSEARSIAALERSLSRTFRRIVTNSVVDEAYLRDLDPAASTMAIPNGVDTEYFAPNEGPPSTHKVVFTGVMSYGPNEDAASFFAESVLPKIRDRVPAAEFWVVGKSPSERVRDLANLPGVHVTGGVPDVRPYLDDAAVFVCPLRYGSGVKNKVLAALSMRRSVVATSLSLEGLELEPGRELLVADEPATIASEVVRLLEDRDLALRLGIAGQAAVTARYSWEVSARFLEAELERVVQT